MGPNAGVGGNQEIFFVVVVDVVVFFVGDCALSPVKPVCQRHCCSNVVSYLTSAASSYQTASGQCSHFKYGRMEWTAERMFREKKKNTKLQK